MWEDALIEYTNVFRSRSAHAALVVVNNDGRQKELSILERSLQKNVFKEVQVTFEDPRWTNLLSYLVEKGFLGSSARRSGRYKGFSVRVDGESYRLYRGDEVVSKILATPIDLSFSDPRIKSTVGVPTSDNIAEVIGTAIDLGFCNSKGQNLRLGDLLERLPGLAGEELVNPYIVDGLELIYFYALFRFDFFFILSVCRFLQEKSKFERDELISFLPKIAEGAIQLAEMYFPRREIVRRLKRYHNLLEGSLQKFDKSVGRGPGVLEHRLTPRLEYLVDIGFLSKLGKRNSFSYQVEGALNEFLTRTGRFDSKLEKENLLSAYVGSIGGEAKPIEFSDIVAVYDGIAPRVGSISIDHLAIGVLTQFRSSDARSFYKRLFERGGERYVRFTGGRYNRAAEYVWIDVKSAANL